MPKQDKGSARISETAAIEEANTMPSWYGHDVNALSPVG
jgi:hypothetical protein